VNTWSDYYSKARWHDEHHISLHSVGYWYILERHLRASER
jgi:hypothetical protein